MNLQTFLDQANEKARTRLFDRGDYHAYLLAIRTAKYHAKKRNPHYRTAHAGSVANAYGSTTTTAQWGVWTTADGRVQSVVHRVAISGRSVRAPYYGGERQYRLEFKQAQLAGWCPCGAALPYDDEVSTQYCSAACLAQYGRPADVSSE